MAKSICDRYCYIVCNRLFITKIFIFAIFRVRYAIDNILISPFCELINMVLQTEKRYYTPEEYLELEEKAEYKNEYRNGEIIPIIGETTNHNKIAGNFCRKFPLTVQAQAYDIYMADVKVSIPRYRHPL